MEWNDKLLEMLGFLTEEEKLRYRHMPFLGRIHSQDKKHTRSAIQDHLLSNKPFELEFRIQAKSGDYLWVTANGKAMRKLSGNLNRFIGVLTDITEQYHSKQRIEFKAYHDSLTRLPNRASLMDRVATQISQQPDVSFAIMLMDLNRFKQVNDTLGHSAGDAVLVHVAQTISNTLRKQDHVSRFGGDEFVFKIAATTGQEDLAIAQRILAVVQGTFLYKNTKIPVEGCIGISLYPLHASSSEKLIRKADIAMYHAKSQQDDKAQIYHPELEPE